jgi:hypothetical protein
MRAGAAVRAFGPRDGDRRKGGNRSAEQTTVCIVYAWHHAPVPMMEANVTNESGAALLITTASGLMA